MRRPTPMIYGGRPRRPPQIIYPYHHPEAFHNSLADSAPDSRAVSPQTDPRQLTQTTCNNISCRPLTCPHVPTRGEYRGTLGCPMVEALPDLPPIFPPVLYPLPSPHFPSIFPSPILIRTLPVPQRSVRGGLRQFGLFLFSVWLVQLRQSFKRSAGARALHFVGLVRLTGPKSPSTILSSRLCLGTTSPCAVLMISMYIAFGRAMLVGLLVHQSCPSHLDDLGQGHGPAPGQMITTCRHESSPPDGISYPPW